MKLNCTDLEWISSSDGKRSNDRFCCMVCIEYRSDDKSKTFTQNNKNTHLWTAKHQILLNICKQKLKRGSVQAQSEPTPLMHSVLLPLPEMPPAPPASLDNQSSDMFRNFQHLGLAFLDENGEEVEFSVGAISDEDRDHQTQNQETETIVSECSDAEESDVSSEWATQDGGLKDYCPYPSKTVSDKS